MKNNGEILAAFLRKYKEFHFFLHNTKDFDTITRIMEEGFLFESQISRSTDRVNPNEPIEVTYFMFQRKDYGSYTVVIAIPKVIYEIYTEVSYKKDIGIEEVMSVSAPYLGDNDELIYTLSPKHILGYFNLKTSEFQENKNWDPDYNNCNHLSFND